MKYVVMVRDNLYRYEDDDRRASGSPALEKEYTYPEIDWNNECEVDAFNCWKYGLEEALQKEWEKIYGPESTVFLERKYSDMSIADWRALGYEEDFGYYG